MARFPHREAEVVALAHQISTGLADHAALFPAPPMSPVALNAAREAYIAAKNALVEAAAAYKAALDEKDAALRVLTRGMRKNLRYAENAVDRNGAQLGLLGWGGHGAGTALTAPGQPKYLVAVEQGENWVRLRWKAPDDGGAVAVYKIERKRVPAGPWEMAGMSVRKSATLPDQPRGQELEYRVVAFNRVGDGLPSNSVAAVL